MKEIGAIQNIGEFSLEKTLNSGQMFRYKRMGKAWSIQSEDQLAVIEQQSSNLVFYYGDVEYWRNYLSINEDYSEIYELMQKDKTLAKMLEVSKGVKILKQDTWETIVCFIISQRNNIPKIKTTVNKLCNLCGKEIANQEVIYKAFPSAAEILEQEYELYTIGLGYRDKYIIDVANEVYSSNLDIQTLKQMQYQEAMEALKSIYGIGDKVANCIALFGLGNTEAFPIDVWIERAINQYFGGSLDISEFGKWAGIIQQFIFYYMKNK